MTIKPVRKSRTLDQLEEHYFRDHPREIDPYVKEIFADYAEDGDSAALLASLRIIARVKGISALAEQTGMSRQGLQKALSGKGNPRLDSINSIMHALGYRLKPERFNIHS
jgi:HTH-type transcriptional regulator/antitoxin HigA